MFDYITKHYRAVKAGVKAATTDFSDGFNSEKQFLVDQKMVASCNAKLDDKLVKKMFGGKLKDAKYAAMQRINAFSAKKSVAYRVGQFCRHPIAGIKSYVVDMYKKFMKLSTMQKVVSVVSVVGCVSVLAFASSVVGVTTVVVSSITAAASIAFSRYVFIRNGIAGWIETIVDVMLFALCAVVTYYMA